MRQGLNIKKVKYEKFEENGIPYYRKIETIEKITEFTEQEIERELVDKTKKVNQYDVKLQKRLTELQEDKDNIKKL